MVIPAGGLVKKKELKLLKKSKFDCEYEQNER